MKVTLLGTGTPIPSAERFGAAVLIEAAGKKLLFDCGRGAVIRLAGAGVEVKALEEVFLTHLHSDHLTGLPDLWLTGWFMGRTRPLRLRGPAGTQDLARHLAAAFAFDVRTRVASDGLPVGGAELEAHELMDGATVEEGRIRILAFTVDHGPVRPALGYRVDFAGHSVVISGDTKFSQHVLEQGKGVDCLIHVAWSVGATNPTPPAQRSLASAEDAGRVFASTRPRLAVVYHYQEEAGLAAAIRQSYDGPLVIARDLMTVRIAREIIWRNGTEAGTIP